MGKQITKGSDNVFADLGIASPTDHLLKAELVSRLSLIIDRKKITQTEAAKLTGVSQPDLSRMLRGQFRDVSAERILRAIVRLGSVVDIGVSTEGQPVGETIHLHAMA